MMEINGKSADGAAYLVSVTLGGDAVEARLSDALLSSEYGRSATVTHQEAYEWISTNAHDIRDAVAQRFAGRTPRKPYDQITLA